MKETMHYSWRRRVYMTACGSEVYNTLKITDVRSRVTCKRCKRTKRWRKIKNEKRILFIK